MASKEEKEARDKKHQPAVDNVLAAVDAAGTDPRARVEAAIRQVSKNSLQLRGENDHREARAHFEENLSSLLDYCFKPA